MADNEVKVTIRQELEGDALDKTKRDVEALEKSAERAQGKIVDATGPAARTENRAPLQAREASAADRAYNQDATRSAREAMAGGQAAAAPGLSDGQWNKEAIEATRNELLAARAGGDTAGAEALERELEVMKEAARIRRGTTLSEEEATKLARERVELQRQEATAAVAAAQAKKQAAQEERVATRAAAQERRAKEEAAVARARGGVGGSALAGVGRGVLGEVGQMGPLSGLARFGLPGAVLAAAGTVAGIFQERSHNSRMTQLHSGANQLALRREMEILRGPDGSAGAARSVKIAAETEESAIRSRQAQLYQEQAKFSLKNLWGNLTGSNDREREELEADRKQAADRAKDAGKAQEEHWGKIGALEQEALSKRLAGDRVGARELEHRVLRQKEYNRLIVEGASKETATKGADMAVKEAQRKEDMQFARLVTVNSGAGDVSRAASLARGDFRANGAGDIRELTTVVKQQHMEAMQANSKKDIRHNR